MSEDRRESYRAIDRDFHEVERGADETYNFVERQELTVDESDYVGTRRSEVGLDETGYKGTTRGVVHHHEAGGAVDEG